MSDSFLTPGAGESLEFNASSTVSGVLIQDAVYRLCADNACWFEVDDGGGGMAAKDTTAVYLPANVVEFITTSTSQYVLHALGVTTSGFCNYIHMEE